MRILSTLLFFVCSLSHAAWAEVPFEKARMPVGVVIPLTGEVTFFGTALQQGIQMAVSDGRTPDLNFIFEDDRSGDRAATVSAIHSLVARHKVRVVIVTGMPNAVVADPIVQKEKVVALSAWDSNHAIEQLSDNTLGFGWSNEKTGQAMGNFSLKTLGARTAAVVVAHDEWSEIMGQAFSNAFVAGGGKVIFHDSVELDGTDFRSLAAKIVHANPSVVYFPLYRSSLLSFARQIKQAGYSGILLSAEGITSAEVKQLGKLAEGMYVTGAYLDDGDFEQRYKSRFGLSKVELNLAHVALGYDLAVFLNACVADLLKEHEEISIEKLRAVMASVVVKGILGTTSFGGRKTTEREQVILQAQDGKLSRVPHTVS